MDKEKISRTIFLTNRIEILNDILKYNIDKTNVSVDYNYQYFEILTGIDIYKESDILRRKFIKIIKSLITKYEKELDNL